MRDLDLHAAAVSKQVGEADALAPEEMEALYAWIDGVPLSRPKRNFARDFSDGVLVAEVVRHFVPRLVDMHNYVPAQSVAQKQSNWETVQAKLLKRLKMRITPAQIQAIVSAKPMHIEPVLHQLREKIEAYLANGGGGGGAAGPGGGAGERSRAERDRKRAEREEARAVRDAARAAKLAERRNRPPVDPWSKLHGGVAQDIAKTGAGRRAGAHDHPPTSAPSPQPPVQPRRRGRRSEPQLGGEPPVGASPGELNLWNRQQAAREATEGRQASQPRQQPTRHPTGRQKGRAAAPGPRAATRTGKATGVRAAQNNGGQSSGGGDGVGNGAAPGGFDVGLLAEKDKVIRGVRNTFSSCSDKISNIEQMLGLGVGGAAAGSVVSYNFSAPGPGSAPAAVPPSGPSYAETQYNVGW